MPPKALTGWSLFFLTIALGLGTFIQILDSSIANVSIPHMAGDLAVSPNQGTWVITSFSISNAIVLALTGWLSNRIGSVRLFVGSTALFSLTSWFCGLAWSLPALIFFRILQGASAGALIPLSQALLIMNYPEGKKGIALGFWGMIVIVAPILGPIVGGYITDNYGWPWIFYINLPLGFLSSWLTWILIGNGTPQTLQRTPIDLIGLLLLITGVSALQIFLDQGNDLDWFNSITIRILAVMTFIAFSFFITWNFYAIYPIINFDYFKHRNFVVGTLLSSLGYMLFFGSAVLLPLWLQTQMNYTAFWAGVAIMPVGLFPLFLSPLVGKILNRVDPRVLATFSFACFAASFFWFSTLNSFVGLYEIMLPRLFQGIGVSFFFIPLIAIALSPFNHADLAGASGVFNFIRLVTGGGFGTALSVTFWNRREIFHHARLTESFIPSQLTTSQFYEELNAINIHSGMTDEIVEQIITQQAYVLAINDIFYFSAWAFLVSIPFIWFCQRPQAEKLISATAE